MCGSTCQTPAPRRCINQWAGSGHALCPAPCSPSHPPTHPRMARTRPPPPHSPRPVLRPPPPPPPHTHTHTLPLPTPTQIAGNSVHVDLAFLRRHMPALCDHLHYRIIDVSTVGELCRRWFPREYGRGPKKRNTHTAMSGGWGLGRGQGGWGGRGAGRGGGLVASGPPPRKRRAHPSTPCRASPACPPPRLPARSQTSVRVSSSCSTIGVPSLKNGRGPICREPCCAPFPPGGASAPSAPAPSAALSFPPLPLCALLLLPLLLLNEMRV